MEYLEQSMVDKSLVSRQEAKIRELETRLEFEKTQAKRLEVGSATCVLHCKPSKAALVAGATHALKGCASQGHSSESSAKLPGQLTGRELPSCSLGPAEPACFTFCLRACFLPRDQSSLAFRLHIFLCHELPLLSPSLTLW